MANIIAHDNAVFIDAEDKTLDKVLKQTKEDITATATAVASADNLANVKIGDNVNVTEDGTISVPLATNNEHGVIIPGIGLNIDNQIPGQLDISLGDGLDATYQGDISLSKATANSLGGIKVGSGLIADLDGTLTLNYQDTTDINDFSDLIPSGLDEIFSGWQDTKFARWNSSLTPYTRWMIDAHGVGCHCRPIASGNIIVNVGGLEYSYLYNIYLNPGDLKKYVIYKSTEL